MYWDTQWRDFGLHTSIWSGSGSTWPCFDSRSFTWNKNCFPGKGAKNKEDRMNLGFRSVVLDVGCNPPLLDNGKLDVWKIRNFGSYFKLQVISLRYPNYQLHCYSKMESNCQLLWEFFNLQIVRERVFCSLTENLTSICSLFSCYNNSRIESLAQARVSDSFL